MQKNYTIVIADDDEDDHFLFIEAVSLCNFAIDIKPVYNGLQLIHLLSQSALKPDLIILDLNMPVLDGFEALKKIKADERMQHIPVYILSTTGLPETVDKAKHLGAQGFYCKPSKLDTLKMIIEEIILRLQY